MEINTESASCDPPNDNIRTGMFAFLFIVICYAVYSINLFLCQCSLHAVCLHCWPLANCRGITIIFVLSFCLYMCMPLYVIILVLSVCLCLSDDNFQKP